MQLISHAFRWLLPLTKISRQKFVFIRIWLCIAVVTITTNLNAQSLSATADFAKLYIDTASARVEFAVYFDNTTLHYRKGAKGYKAEVAISQKIFYNGRLVDEKKARLVSPDLPDSTLGDFSLGYQDFIIAKKGELEFKITATDVNNPDTSALHVDFQVKISVLGPKIRFSEIEFLTSFSKTPEDDIMGRDGFRPTMYTSAFYNEKATKLKTYLELYNPKYTPSDTAPIALSYRIFDRNGVMLENYGMILRKKQNWKIAQYQELDITALPSGNYSLRVDAVLANKTFAAIGKKKFSRSNPKYDDIYTTTQGLAGPKITSKNFADTFGFKNLRKYLLFLDPIATSVESNTIQAIIKGKSINEMRLYLVTFWTRRSKENAEAAFNGYKDRIDFAQSKYGTRTSPAFTTDRGRTYLKYGKPNQILNEVSDPANKTNSGTDQTTPYEIWMYYALEGSTQTGVQYVYIQTAAGGTNFVLVHTTQRGGLSNANWRQLLSR